MSLCRRCRVPHSHLVAAHAPHVHQYTTRHGGNTLPYLHSTHRPLRSAIPLLAATGVPWHLGAVQQHDEFASAPAPVSLTDVDVALLEVACPYAFGLDACTMQALGQPVRMPSAHDFLTTALHQLGYDNATACALRIEQLYDAFLAVGALGSPPGVWPAWGEPGYADATAADGGAARMALMDYLVDLDESSPRNRRLFESAGSCCIRRTVSWTGGDVGSKGDARQMAINFNEACAHAAHASSASAVRLPSFCIGPHGKRVFMMTCVVARSRSRDLPAPRVRVCGAN